jgi:hypothetical protein
LNTPDVSKLSLAVGLREYKFRDRVKESEKARGLCINGASSDLMLMPEVIPAQTVLRGFLSKGAGDKIASGT